MVVFVLFVMSPQMSVGWEIASSWVKLVILPNPQGGVAQVSSLDVMMKSLQVPVKTPLLLTVEFTEPM